MRRRLSQMLISNEQSKNPMNRTRKKANNPNNETKANVKGCRLGQAYSRRMHPAAEKAPMMYAYSSKDEDIATLTNRITKLEKSLDTTPTDILEGKKYRMEYWMLYRQGARIIIPLQWHHIILSSDVPSMKLCIVSYLAVRYTWQKK